MRMAVSGPVTTQYLKGESRQGDIAVLLALAEADMNPHSPTVDIAEFNPQRIADTQTLAETGHDIGLIT